MGYALLLLLCAGQDGRKPIPEADRLKAAEKLVREILAEDFAKKGLDSRRALLKKLLQQAADADDDSAAGYYLLREAQAVAVEIGDVSSGLSATQELAKRFEVDGPAATSSFLAEVSKAAKLPATHKSVAEACLVMHSEAMRKEDYVLAERAAKEGLAAARKAKDVGLVGQADAGLKAIGPAKVRSEAFSAARENLGKDANDPSANLVVGIHLCLALESWDVGLPHLAKGSDAELKRLAQADLANPAEASGQLSVGDGWWDQADKGRADQKGALRRRAGAWYARSLPQLSGLTKVRVEKRLLDIGGEVNPSAKAKAAASAGTVDLSMLVDVARDSVDKAWTREGTSIVSPPGVPAARLQVPYAPPEEYELTLIVQKRGTVAPCSVNVGLVAGGTQFTVAIDADDGRTVGIGTLDGKTAHSNESTVRDSKVFTDDKPKVLVFQVRKDGITVTCDARPLLAWKGAYQRCGVHPVNAVPNRRELFLVSRNAELAFSRMTLVPLRN